MKTRFVRRILAALSIAAACCVPSYAIDSQLLIASYQADQSGLWLASKGRAAAYAPRVSNDSQVHAYVWQRFKQLFPAPYSNLVKEFEVASDGLGNITAYSGLSNKQFGAWVLGIDPADVFPGGRLDKAELDASLIHEFGHILFQRVGQMQHSRRAFAALRTPGYQREVQAARAACQTFFTFDACAEPDSYLYHYMYAYWQPMLTAWVQSGQTQMARKAFLNNHHKGFVSGYAATHPVEDMVETFTAFVLRPTPQDQSLSARKIQFFYQYPEMVQLRAHIRANL